MTLGNFGYSLYGNLIDTNIPQVDKLRINDQTKGRDEREMNHMVMINDGGDIMIAGGVIKRERWSRCIPMVLESLDQHLQKLFPAAKDLLEKAFDVRNPLVLDGENSYVIDASLGVGEDSKIDLGLILQSLVDRPDVHDAVASCFAFRYLVLKYLGANGASFPRATEVDLLPEDLSIFGTTFNSLHYQFPVMKPSCFNPDPTPNHYIPPSLSRRIVVISACLYPALLRRAESGAFRVPDKTKLARLANSRFKEIMGTDVELSPMKCRQAVTAIWNFAWPIGGSHLSYQSYVRDFFRHGQEMHYSFCGHKVVSVESEGVDIPSDSMIAREIWRAMGEGDVSLQVTDSLVSSMGRFSLQE